MPEPLDPLQEKIIRILLQFGLDRDSIKDVRSGALTIDQALQKVQADAAKAGKTVPQDVNKISNAFSNLHSTGMLLIEMGRGAGVFGSIFDSEGLRRIGEYAHGLGEVVIAAGRLKSVLGELSESGILGAVGGLVGGVGAALGGGGLLYEGAKAVGAFGLSEASPGAIDVARRGIEEAFTTLKIGIVGTAASVTQATQGAEAAQKTFLNLSHVLQIIPGDVVAVTDEFERMIALNQQYQYQPTGRAAFEAPLAREGITDTTLTGLKEQEAKYKDILHQLETGQMLEGPEMFLAKAQTRLKLIEAAIAAIEKEMADSPAGKAQAGAITDYLGGVRAQIDRARAIQQAFQDYGAAQQKASIELATRERDDARTLSQQRLKLAVDSSRAMLQLENDYYAQRAKVAASFGIETQRMEEDHLIQVRRAQQDHTIRVRKLAELRDAGAIEDENEQYKLTRDRAEEDYQKQAARRNEDFARQLQEMEDAFRQQRDRRQEADQQQLQDLATHLSDQRELTREWYNAIEADIKEKLMAAVKGGVLIANPPGGTTANPIRTYPLMGGYETGGYLSNTGTAFMHAGEFVLSRSAVDRAERLIGGKLNQQNITGAAQISITQSFSGEATEPSVYKQIMYDVIVDVFNRARSNS